MAGPWEKYQQPQEAGPWAKYAQQPTAEKTPDAKPKPAQKPKSSRPDFSGVTSRVIPRPMTGALASTKGAKTVPYQPGMGHITLPWGDPTPESRASANALEMEARARAQVQDSALGNFAYGAGSAVARNARGIGQLMGAVSPQDEANARELEKYVNQSYATRAGNVASDVAMFAVPGSKIAALPAAGRYLGSAALGAGIGYAQPVTDGESRGVNAAIGGLAGAAGQGVADVLTASGRAASKAIAPHVRELYEKAKSMGVQLTPAQLSDSGFVRRLSLMLDKLPFSGAAKGNKAQNDAGNRAIAKLIGEDASVVDQSVAANAASRLGEQFDNVFASGMKYDRQFLREVAGIKREAQGQMDETAVRTVTNWVERLKNQSKDGAISGRTLQSLDQSARKAATGGGDRQQAAQAFRDALHRAYGRQAAPETKQAWDAARRQYATLKTIEPIIARNPEGGIPMQQLQGAINATKAGKTARARGNDGELGALATIGQKMKGPHSSGTAENLQAAGIGAGAISSPLLTLLTLGAGAGASRGLRSGILADIMMRNGAGETRQALAPFARAAVMAAPSSRKKRDDKPRR